MCKVCPFVYLYDGYGIYFSPTTGCIVSSSPCRWF